MGAKPVEQSPKPVTAGSVANLTRSELETAGRLETALGQSALAIAVRIDAADTEAGSAMAALVREHRAALAEALKGAYAVANPLDELRARRDRKRAG